MIDFQVAYDKLAQFETADELAYFFQSEGVKAKPEKISECAIAKWMQKTTGIETFVTYEEICIRAEKCDDNSFVRGPRTESTFLTDAMNDFVRRFDQEDYPSLIG